MAHYAFLDDNNIVTEVITGKDETELIEGLEPEEWYGNFRGQKCLCKSYNGHIRYHYAQVGGYYDPIDDAFIGLKPQCGHEELALNENKKWKCPTCEAEWSKIDK